MNRDIYYIGSKFEETYGFSKAVKHNGVIYVSGSSGYNYEKGEVSPDATEQLRQAFTNIEAALRHFGSDLTDLLQIQLFYSDQEVWDEIGATLPEFLKPSGTTLFAVESKMPIPEFKIEIVALAAARN